jgi:Kef-type K+ transport system membrane component KefB
VTALNDHQLLVLLVQLALLVGVARTLGGLARRLGQPPVVGELLAGVLLGPSVLARIAPEVDSWAFVAAPRVSAVTFGLARLAFVSVLVVMSYETDVLGASARPLSHRPFLGHRVGVMIEHASVPVVVIALPSGA